MIRIIAGIVFLFLAAGGMAAVPAGEPVSAADVQRFIQVFRIDLGSSLSAGDKFIRLKDLQDLEKVVGFKTTLRKGGSDDALSFTAKVNEQDPAPEIGIYKLPSQELARKYAVHMFLTIEDGRARQVSAVHVTQGWIGDLCLSPKKIENKSSRKPIDADKTFLVFARNTVAVYIDSKSTQRPKIDVPKIAQYIDEVIRFAE